MSVETKVVVYGAWCHCHPARGVYYVGQTKFGVVSRWNTHLWNADKPHARMYNSRFSRWIRKHGPDNVAFSVLEVCTEIDLDDREIYWISHLRGMGQAQANLLSGGSNPTGHKRPAQSKRMTGENNPMYGRDRKELMAYARSFQGPASEETRRKMGDAHRGSKNARARITEGDVRNIRRRYTGAYGELSAMGREYGLTAQSISGIVKRETWKHVED